MQHTCEEPVEAQGSLIGILDLVFKKLVSKFGKSLAWDPSLAALDSVPSDKSSLTYELV